MDNIVLLVCFHVDAHSFPPSSLDYRSTELIVSPKKVVGCRGVPQEGGRVLGIPLHENTKNTKFPCHVF